jgi:hypothetical protein
VNSSTISGTDARRTSTPLADAVLGNPLAIPAGVADWLRGWERVLREFREEIATALERYNWLLSLAESRAELDLLLEDEHLSAFRRLLRRPLNQLTSDGAARQSFDWTTEQIVLRGRTALALAPIAEDCLTKLDSLTIDFEGRMPNRLAELTLRYRLDRERLGRLRRVTDVQEFARYVDLVRSRLTDLARLLDGVRLEAEVVPDDILSPFELFLALSLRRRERDSSAQLESAVPFERLELGRHLDDLAREPIAAASLTQPPRALGFLLEGALAHVRGTSIDVPYGWPDGALWVGAIAAINARRFGSPGSFSWVPLGIAGPHGQNAETTEEDNEIGPLRVMPLDRELAFISQSVRSAIRVWSASAELGSTVEAQVAPDDAKRQQPGIVASDVEMVFDGFDPRQTRWYETKLRVELRLIAKCADGWFARVVHRGELEPCETPPWQTAGSGSSFRVLLSADSLRRNWEDAEDSDDVIEVARLASSPMASFLGFGTNEVVTGLLEHQRAWLRTSTHPWQAVAVGLRRERDLFRRMAKKPSGAEGLVQVATARLAGTRLGHPLYRIPNAFFPADLGAFRQRIVEDPGVLVAVITAVARAIRSAHACDFALGVCHLGAFAYAVSWRPNSLVPVPAVVLAHAPCATPVGDRYCPPPSPSPNAVPLYQTLHVPLIPPHVEGQQIAKPEDDMFAFGAFMLDLLLKEPVATGAVAWFDLLRNWKVSTLAAATSQKSLAIALLRAMRDEVGRRNMLVMCDRMTHEEPKDPAAIEGLLRS